MATDQGTYPAFPDNPAPTRPCVPLAVRVGMFPAAPKRNVPNFGQRTAISKPPPAHATHHSPVPASFPAGSPSPPHRHNAASNDIRLDLQAFRRFREHNATLRHRHGGNVVDVGFFSPAMNRRCECIQAGAYRRSCSNRRRSAGFNNLRRCANRSGVTC